MIIRIQAPGGSFRGAGKYYLHDKLPEAERGKELSKELMPSTDERVWFTDTRNCANLDPEKALDEMWHVAENQQWLKAQAGGRTSGRVCQDPVKTISLSWHKDDPPTPEQMIEAADAYLKHMGWDGHQAVYVGHRDTEHRHVHIILNRVNHEHGRTLDDYRDQPRSQAWALQYEKEMGKLWCVERELNAAEREKRAPELDMAVRQPEPERETSPERKPANQHIPHNVIELQKPYAALHEAHEQARLDATLEAERGILKAEQRAEREAWFKEGKDLFRQTRHAVYDAVREEFREQWRDLYRDRAAATREAEAHSGSAMDRAFHFAQHGDWDKALAAFGDRNAVRDDAAREMAERLAALKAEQTAAIRERQDDAIRELREQRDAQYKELLERQREERTAMRAAHVQGQSAAFVLDMRHAGPQPETGKVIANDNRTPVVAAEMDRTHSVRSAPIEGHRDAPAPMITETRPEILLDLLRADPAPARDDERAIEGGTFSISTPEAPEPAKQTPDLAAGAMGTAANYLADQMAEMLAPTPPEVREARAKVATELEASKPPAEPTMEELRARRLEAVLRQMDQVLEDKRSRDYWQDRKERERDR
jgi:hypothetical protein